MTCYFDREWNSEIVDLPKGKNAIDNKWPFKIKRDLNGNNKSYKARLVIKGYWQRYGIDYEKSDKILENFQKL